MVIIERFKIWMGTREVSKKIDSSNCEWKTFSRTVHSGRV